MGHPMQFHDQGQAAYVFVCLVGNQSTSAPPDPSNTFQTCLQNAINASRQCCPLQAQLLGALHIRMLTRQCCACLAGQMKLSPMLWLWT